MNCRDVAKWLVDADAVATVPEGVSGHLAGCVRCRRRRLRVYRLNCAIATLPAPADNPSARARIMEKIGQPATVNGNSPHPAMTRLSFPAPAGARRSSWRWRTILARAAVILLMVGGFGWLATTQDADTEPDVPIATSGDEDLLVKLIDGHVQLAEGQTQEMGFQVLADMAHNLQGESFRLARDNAAAELPALAKLYARVVHDGLVARARLLPDKERQDLLKPLLEDLNRTQSEANRLAKTAAPTVAQPLLQLAVTARKAHQQLSWPGAEKALQSEWPPPRRASAQAALWQTLVKESLQIADETDSLRRASSSSRVADQLAEAIVGAAAEGKEGLVEKLSRLLGKVLDRGIDQNVATLDPQELDDAGQAEYRILVERQESIRKLLVAKLGGLGKPHIKQAFDHAGKDWGKFAKKLGPVPGKGLGPMPSKGVGPGPGKGFKKDPFKKGDGKGNGKKDKNGKKDRKNHTRAELKAPNNDAHPIVMVAQLCLRADVPRGRSISLPLALASSS